MVAPTVYVIMRVSKFVAECGGIDIDDNVDSHVKKVNGFGGNIEGKFDRWTEVTTEMNKVIQLIQGRL